MAERARNLKYYSFTEMSKLFQKTKDNARKLELHWMNIIFQTHDQICRCKDPMLHLIQLINLQNSKKELSIEQLQKIKCHLTGEEEDIQEDTNVLDGVDLEKLFSEPDDGDDAAATG
nr:MAG: hypothetical protein [Betatorquevirus sp.]